MNLTLRQQKAYIERGEINIPYSRKITEIQVFDKEPQTLHSSRH